MKGRPPLEPRIKALEERLAALEAKQQSDEIKWALIKNIHESRSDVQKARYDSVIDESGLRDQLSAMVHSRVPANPKAG
jgi:hypothetical protein